jgi:hypothetical protein
MSVRAQIDAELFDGVLAGCLSKNRIRRLSQDAEHLAYVRFFLEILQIGQRLPSGADKLRSRAQHRCHRQDCVFAKAE